MKVNIYHFDKEIRKGKLIHSIVPRHLGYVEVEEFNEEEIWHLCNWDCWTEEKPTNLHADIERCDHGLCLINPETEERWLATSLGWLTGSEKTISEYVLKNRYNVFWE